MKHSPVQPLQRRQWKKVPPHALHIFQPVLSPSYLKSRKIIKNTHTQKKKKKMALRYIKLLAELPAWDI